MLRPVIARDSWRTGRTIALPSAAAPLLATLIVSAAFAAVIGVLGPLDALRAAVAITLVLALLGRLEWTIGLYVLINLMASSHLPIGGGVALSSIAAPARAIALLALGIQALRYIAWRRVPIGGLLGPLLPLALAVGASLAVAPSLPSRASDAVPMVSLIAALAIVAWPISERNEDTARVLIAVAAAYGVVLVLNIVLLPLAPASGYPGRFSGILENPNSVGALGFGLPALAYAAFVQPRGSRARWLFLTLTALLVLEVLLSVSRAGILGMLTAGAVMFFGLTRQRLGVRAAVTFVAIGALALLTVGGVTGRLTKDLRFSSISSGSGRSAAWSWSAARIRERPILGHGYGSSPELLAQFTAEDQRSPHPSGFVGYYAGNVFLDLGLELGFVGIGAFLVAVGVALNRLRDNRFGGLLRPGRAVGSVCLAMLLGGMVEAQGESFVLAPGGAVTIAFWLALTLGSAHGYRQRLALRATS